MAFSSSRRRRLALAAERMGTVKIDPVEKTLEVEPAPLPSYAELKTQADLLGIPGKGRPRSRAGLAKMIEEYGS